jgi:hypothetical protein
LEPLSIPPPLAGGGWGEGDKKGNSYTIKLLINTLDSGFHRSDDFLRDHHISLPLKIDENGALEAIVVMPQARVIDFNSTLARSSAGFSYELKLSLASK